MIKKFRLTTREGGNKVAVLDTNDELLKVQHVRAYFKACVLSGARKRTKNYWSVS